MFIFRNLLNSQKSRDIALILSRISIGLFFLTTGYNKLFIDVNQKIMLDTIIAAGIPFPEFSAIAVSLLEFILGTFLILGLFTQLSSIILIIICLTAFFTVGFYELPKETDVITWLSWLFYSHDLLYFLILFFILSNKADPLTLDNIIIKKISKS